MDKQQFIQTENKYKDKREQRNSPDPNKLERHHQQ